MGRNLDNLRDPVYKTQDILLVQAWRNGLKYTNSKTSNDVKYITVDIEEQTHLLADMGKEDAILLPLKYNNIGKFKVNLS